MFGRLYHIVVAAVAGSLVLAIVLGGLFAVIQGLLFEFLGLDFWTPVAEEAVEIPFVQADPSPVRVKPDDPGGMDVPNRDNDFLNRRSDEAPRVERLLPPPEVPLPAALPSGEGETAVPAPPKIEAPDVEAPDVEGPDLEGPDVEGPEPAGAPEVAAPADAIAELVEKVETAASQAAPAEPAETQVAEVVGTLVLQLASLKSGDAARREWARLQESFPDLLTGLSLIVQEAEVDEVGQVYRLQIGTFPTRSTAADLCAELKARKQDCFILQR